ncbi:polysaccharide biosynthesis protein [Neobacillus sp. PS3-12]|nr:polysaccharide biosynthesis protein [Neobacillus sp. PS3-12]WML55184.1 polysaccharide biosynthesis protein [Neobacillus sp. PS3-12]
MSACSRNEQASLTEPFITQIKSGDPQTGTVPNMTRFLISLEEAVELVVFDFYNAEAEILWCKRSPACTIGDLAISCKETF